MKLPFKPFKRFPLGYVPVFSELPPADSVDAMIPTITIKNNNKNEVCMLPEGGSTLKIFDGTLLSDLPSLVMRNLEFSATKTKKTRGLSWQTLDHEPFTSSRYQDNVTRPERNMQEFVWMRNLTILCSIATRRHFETQEHVVALFIAQNALRILSD